MYGDSTPRVLETDWAFSREPTLFEIAGSRSDRSHGMKEIVAVPTAPTLGTNRTRGEAVPSKPFRWRFRTEVRLTAEIALHGPFSEGAHSQAPPSLGVVVATTDTPPETVNKVESGSDQSAACARSSAMNTAAPCAPASSAIEDGERDGASCPKVGILFNTLTHEAAVAKALLHDAERAFQQPPPHMCTHAQVNPAPGGGLTTVDVDCRALFSN